MDKKSYLSNLRVLLVEDDLDTLRQMEIMLRRRCGKVYTANNGKLGIKVYESVDPDVIITDLKMPLMGGIEMSRKIRETDRETPIIITTAFDDKEVILKAVDVGINKYIVKPIDTEALLGALSEVSVQVLKIQDGILTGSGLIVDREEKLKKEADIKQIFATLLKEETGKGPQVVKVFTQGTIVKVTLDSVLTKMELSMIANEKNYRMISYTREVFYLDRKERMEKAMSGQLGMDVMLRHVTCNAKENRDDLQFELKIY